MREEKESIAVQTKIFLASSGELVEDLGNSSRVQPALETDKPVALVASGLGGHVRWHSSARRDGIRSETGIATYATKVRLQAEAYLPGTNGSDPFPSSGESASRGISPLRGNHSRKLTAQVEALSPRPPADRQDRAVACEIFFAVCR
jgi:hypothetical protein